MIVAALPGLALLLRGLVWGSDSFAFWAVSCGQSQYAQSLSVWFPGFNWFLENIIACNLYHFVLIQFVLYFFALVAVYVIGKPFLQDAAWRLPVYLGLLTPLFFIEVLRFENDFFGWTLALIAVGVWSIGINSNNLSTKAIALILATILCFFSVLLWLPSILICFLCFLVLKLPLRIHKIGTILFILTFLILATPKLIPKLDGLNMVAEEIPLLGLIFILHIIHFWKQTPQPYTYYTWFLLGLGLFKMKYLYLVTPFLLIPLIIKQTTIGLTLKREIFGIKEIPVLYICLILGVGWIVMATSMYPTSTDLKEAKNAIELSEELNVPLYNDWGDGWMFVSLGYDTNYKIFFPNPDWNKLDRPFVAWSQEKINGCEMVDKRTQKCN